MDGEGHRRPVPAISNAGRPERAEASLLVYPGIDGLAGVPSVFEFIGNADERPAGGRSLRHIGTETLEGGLAWLRYRVEAPGAA